MNIKRIQLNEKCKHYFFLINISHASEILGEFFSPFVKTLILDVLVRKNATQKSSWTGIFNNKLQSKQSSNFSNNSLLCKMISFYKNKYDFCFLFSFWYYQYVPSSIKWKVQSNVFYVVSWNVHYYVLMFSWLVSLIGFAEIHFHGWFFTVDSREFTFCNTEITTKKLCQKKALIYS